MSASGTIIGVGPASADTVGPAIKYFKAEIPVVGGVLSDSSASPTVPIKYGWSVNDGDGVCRAFTELTPNAMNKDVIWNYFGGKPDVSVSSTHTYNTRVGGGDRFVTNATDCLGNVTESVSLVACLLYQQVGDAASYSAGWSTATGAMWSGGSVMKSTKVGATVTYTFRGTLISLISDKAADRGNASLSVDGGIATVINLQGSTLNRVIASKSAYQNGDIHQLTVKVVSGGVDIDGFLIQQ
jgi:hypothetical protein